MNGHFGLLGRERPVTLATLLALLQDGDHVFIAHSLGPHECESAAEGTVQELRSTRCMEVCGDNVVEHLALDMGGQLEMQPDAPVLVITIGGKAAEEWMEEYNR